MQFNLLAEGLSSKPAYGGFDQILDPEICLNFETRRWRLLEEIMRMGPDLLAIEEVDHYASFFEPVLAKLGYEGLFMPKSASPCLRLGYYSDGCALFWKPDVFTLITETKNTYTGSGQAYIVTTLQHMVSKRNVVFGMTHLKAKDGIENEELRVLQATELLQQVQIHAARVSLPAVLVVGDLNSDYSHKGCITVQSMLDSELVQGLSSAYPLSQHTWTTWKLRADKAIKAQIDYIFYKGEGLQLQQVLMPPGEQDLEPTLLPGFRYPSDHLAIAGRFELSAL